MQTIAWFLLILLATTTTGYSEVSWCEHKEDGHSGHLLLENLEDSPFSQHKEQETDAPGDCPGCIHIPVIDVVNLTASDYIAETTLTARDMPPPALPSVPLFLPREGSTELLTPPFRQSSPPDPRLALIRTFILLI